MGPDLEDDEKKAPPEILETILHTITPRTLRPQLKQDFRATYKSPGQLVRKAAKDLFHLIPGLVWNEFQGVLVGAQQFALVVSFLGAPFSIGLVAGFLAGLIILCLRDGHTYPGETPREALLDAVVVVVFIVVSQLFTAYLTSQPALPRDVILRGGAAGVTMLFVLRTIFRDPKPKTPKENAEGCFQVVFAMNCMWLITWIALVWTSPESSSGALDFMFGAVPPIIIFMDMRLRQDSLSSPHMKKPESIRHNRERAELVRKLSWMWLPKGIVSELLFFAVVTAQLVAGFFSQPAADRLPVLANAVVLFMLFIVWRPLRRANRTAGRLLQAEIDKIDQAAAQ